MIPRKNMLRYAHLLQDRERSSNGGQKSPTSYSSSDEAPRTLRLAASTLQVMSCSCGIFILNFVSLLTPSKRQIASWWRLNTRLRSFLNIHYVTLSRPFSHRKWGWHGPNATDKDKRENEIPLPPPHTILVLAFIRLVHGFT